MRPLRVVADVVVQKDDSDGVVPCIDLEHVEGFTGRLLVENDELAGVAGDRIRFLKGDVLTSKLRPYLGKSFLADFDGAASSEFIVLRPKPGTLPQWLQYVTLSKKFTDYAVMTATGVKMPRTGPEHLRRFPINAHSLEMQERIADFLDRETQRIDEARAEVGRLMQLITMRRREALRQRLASEDSTIWRPIWSCIVLNPETLSEGTDSGFQFAYIDIGSITEAEMLTPQEVRFGAAPSRARRVVRAGDVIVSTVRTYLRAVAAVPESLDGAVASTGFAVLRPRPDILDSRYLRYWCMSEDFLSQVVARSYGVSYPAINASDLVRLKMPVPSISEQLSTVEALEAEEAVAKRQADALRSLDSLLKERRVALVTAAVTGQLDVEAMV